MIELCIAESIRSGKQGDPSLTDWLRTAEFSNMLVDIAKEVSNVLDTVDSDKTTAWSILKLCFSSTSDGGKKWFILFSRVRAKM